MALLILGYTLITFLLITVVVSATAVHIARTRLADLADAAALDAADSLYRPGYYGGSGTAPPAASTTGAVPLSDATVRAAVGDYLRVAPVSPSLEGLRIGSPTGAAAADTAQVTLVARIRPPLVTYVLAPWAGGIPVRVTGQARASRHTP